MNHVPTEDSCQTLPDLTRGVCTLEPPMGKDDGRVSLNNNALECHQLNSAITELLLQAANVGLLVSHSRFHLKLPFSRSLITLAYRFYIKSITYGTLTLR